MNYDINDKIELDEYIVNNHRQPYAEFAIEVNEKFGTSFNGESIRKKIRRLGVPSSKSGCRKHPTYKGLRKPTSKCLACLDIFEKNQPHRLVEVDLNALNAIGAKKATDRKYKELLRRLKEAEVERDAVKQIREVSTFEISPKKSSGTSEATAVVLASDWHYEETVRSADVNNLNEFNLGIAESRITQFFQSTKRVLDVLRKDISIDTLVLALLGDFITNDIHEELSETASLSPIEATIEVMGHIASGIKFLLKNTKVDIIIPCHSGNHARTTQKPRHATEAGHSLEYFMYHSLANHFKGNKRVKFLISPSYHSYVKVYDYTIRFHHGHAIKYQGGVGGIYISVNKAIGQWNKAQKADLDCFGHFHQMRDGGNFVVNGSVIGYNAYALANKCEFEKPKQAFFLIDKKRGKTMQTPICFEDEP